MLDQVEKRLLPHWMSSNTTTSGCSAEACSSVLRNAHAMSSADVAASLSIAERLGPERSKILFDDVVRLMREEVERFGGAVAQLRSDGILGLFGAPIAHEDDSERAVRAALAIRDAVEAYAADLASVYGLELRVRAGFVDQIDRLVRQAPIVEVS